MTTANNSSNVQKQQQTQLLNQDDLISLQNDTLKHSKVKFLHTLQPTAGTIYGMKNKPRQDEPSMKDIFTWGYEAPNKGDYIKNDTQIRYKIRKHEKAIISEVKDNYRRPEYSPEKGIYLFNFLDEEGQEKWKRKIYEMAVEGESEEIKKSSYKMLFCGDEKKWWEEVLLKVTPAGKPCYKEVPKELVTPQEFLKQKMEQKILDIIMKNAKLNGKNPDGSNINPDGQTNELGALFQTQQQKQFKIEEELADKENREKLRKERQLKKRAQSAKHKKQLDKRLNEIKSTSRWLPDSGITTYFGKPAFHPYGNGNTNPTVGGPVYGQYLKTHNVNPQSGDNAPEFKQVFGRAMLGTQIVVKGPNDKNPEKKAVRQPALPRKVREDIRLSPSEVEELLNRNPIMPAKFSNDDTEHVAIIKPDLTKEKYLQSKHTTPIDSANQSVITSKDLPRAAQLQTINEQYQRQQMLPVQEIKSQNMSKVSSQKILNPQSVIEVYKNQATHLEGFQTQYQQERIKGQTLGQQDEEKLKGFDMKLIQSSTQYNQQQTLNPQSPAKATQHHPQHHEHSSHCQVQHQLQQQSENTPFNQQSLPFCPVHGASEQPEFLHLLDPKNYKFLPHQYTNAIRPAGRFTHKSEALSGLLSWNGDE